MDCDQFHVDDGAVLNVEDLHMLRKYDSRSHPYNPPLLVKSVEDRKNDLTMKCPRRFGIGPDHRYGQYPYRVVGDATDSAQYTWPEVPRGLPAYAGWGGINGNVPAPAPALAPVAAPVPAPAPAPAPKCRTCGSKPSDDKTLLFFFVILVLVAFCVYLSRSITDLKEYIRDRVQKTT